jgi:stage II sporulation protein R
MKNLCITLLLISIITLTAIGLTLPKKPINEEYLRIHVRANSNLEQDQEVKYLVKDAVVELLTPYIAECDTKKKAENTLKNLIPQIEKRAKEILEENGFTYNAKASIKRENFPTRVYGTLTLEQGFYDALILSLGNAEGDNWWCVVYPPLCFVGEGNVEYKSKIYQIVKDFLDKYKEEK